MNGSFLSHWIGDLSDSYAMPVVVRIAGREHSIVDVDTVEGRIVLMTEPKDGKSGPCIVIGGGPSGTGPVDRREG